MVLTPAVVAHRGASGHRPEHTLGAYRTAIRMGADDIELDLVSTRDGVLVARHDLELSTTTDVASRAALAHLRRTLVVDGVEQHGWFVQDLTARASSGPSPPASGCRPPAPPARRTTARRGSRRSTRCWRWSAPSRSAAAARSG